MSSWVAHVENASYRFKQQFPHCLHLKALGGMVSYHFRWIIRFWKLCISDNFSCWNHLCWINSPHQNSIFPRLIGNASEIRKKNFIFILENSHKKWSPANHRIPIFHRMKTFYWVPSKCYLSFSGALSEKLPTKRVKAWTNCGSICNLGTLIQKMYQ